MTTDCPVQDELLLPPLSPEFRTGDLFTNFVAEEAARIPLPGEATTARFAALTELGRRDLSLARLAEGHLDAAAILYEMERALPAPAERWGVWAARPRAPASRPARQERGGGWTAPSRTAPEPAPVPTRW